MSDLLVKLKIYEGPLDLLLHLIKKNEIDLADIPVALITAQYLEYLDLMEAMNVEVASDFLVMAATLTQIKSRLLLSLRDDDLDGENEAEEALKAAILDPILEHLRFRGFKDFKDAALALQARPILNSDVFVRGHSLDEADHEGLSGPGENLMETNLFDLVDAFRRLAERKEESRTLKFIVETKTINERIREIQALLKKETAVSFEAVCQNDRSRTELVLSFLAILELARTGFMSIYQNLTHSLELKLFLANPDAETAGLDELTY